MVINQGEVLSEGLKNVCLRIYLYSRIIGNEQCNHKKNSYTLV